MLYKNNNFDINNNIDLLDIKIRIINIYNGIDLLYINKK